MRSELIALEQKALAVQNAGRFIEAAKEFAILVAKQHDWEHGGGFYSLACCYDDSGRFVEAEHCYRKALEYDTINPIFLGGLASFLYLHGEPSEAFDTYLNLLRIGKMSGDKEGVARATDALTALSQKIGLSNEQLTKKLAG